MNKGEVMLREIMRHVVDYHEWCEEPNGKSCKACGKPEHGCRSQDMNESSRIPYCDGCKMLRKAKSLLGDKRFA